MPRAAGTGKGRSKPITIRLPDEEFFFYRTKANEGGLAFNTYLTKLLIEGAVALKVAEFEERMAALIGQIPESVRSGGAAIPDAFSLSVLTCEALLSEIASAQDVQVLYRAQEAARSRLRKLKGG
jgi:hypothetical protein